MARTKTWLLAILAILIPLHTFGQTRIQTVSATTTSASSISATITLTAGHLLIVDWYEAAVLASLPMSVSDTQGDVFSFAIGSGKFQTFYVASVHGGSTTVTVSSPGTTTAMDLVLTEVSGTGYYQPLLSRTMGGVSSSTVENTPTPLLLPAGSYFLYTRNCDNSVGSTYTPSSGWTAHTITGNVIHNTYDQVVSPSTPTSYGITITSSAALNSTGDNDTKFPFLAFSTTPVVSVIPHVVQYGASGSYQGDTSTGDYMPLPVTVGNYLLAYAEGNGVGAMTISDTQHSTWTLLQGGTSSDSYAMWITKASASGAETIIASGGQSPSMTVFEVGNSSGIDVRNSATTSTVGASISASITTTVANDLIEEIQSTESGCFTGSGTYGQDTGFIWFTETASHCSFAQDYEGYAVTAGGTYTSSISSGPGLMSAGVVAFKPAVPVTTTAGPVVNVF